MLEAVRQDVMCQICILQAISGSPLVSSTKTHGTVALHVLILQL